MKELVPDSTVESLTKARGNIPSLPLCFPLNQSSLTLSVISSLSPFLNDNSSVAVPVKSYSAVPYSILRRSVSSDERKDKQQ